VITIVVVIGAVMYLVEGDASGFTSIPVSMYWAIVTLTTVGYGDIAPQTVLGRMLASLLMILGYGIIAVPTRTTAMRATARAAARNSRRRNYARIGCRTWPCTSVSRRRVPLW
jgi:voltage-gated potassium channel